MTIFKTHPAEIFLTKNSPLAACFFLLFFEFSSEEVTAVWSGFV